ncbi:MAG: DNA polymerase III subunit alpha [Deltaproteobacteria bacterium]|nr:DNA polymerase III subunit alpha [Deltaproteobacteria bacterium]
MARDFAHLHLHTQYSFLDGAIRVKDLVKAVKAQGMASVAVTDHGNMFGAVDFYKQAKEAGIKPILGCEVYVATKGRFEKSQRDSNHLVLLAETEEGYHNLKKLVTAGYTEGFYYDPRVDKELLKQHSKGIIALTACLGGEVGRKFARSYSQNDPTLRDEAKKAATEYRDIFGPQNFFLEVQPNGVPMQDKVNAHLAELSKDLGLGLIATNDCHYVDRKDARAQDILMCIRQGKAFDDPKRHRHETDAFYIRNGDEMFDLLKTQYAEGYENALKVAERCKVELKLGKYFLPPFPFPEGFKDEADYVAELSRKGLERRFREMSRKVDEDAYRARLQLELGVIVKMGFSGYFLIVQDFINWAKQNGIPVGPGRGSGAGSIVAYALRITDLDPLPYNLLFERFLNPERVSMPDFDVDFCQARRGEVIDYVTQRYGQERVGQIATYAALNAKSVVKDVARVLGVPFAEVNELTKLIPAMVEDPKNPGEKKKATLEDALRVEPKLSAIQEEKPIYKEIMTNALTLEGLYRQAGIHAGGVVIGQEPLNHYTPLFKGAGGEQVTQYNMDKVADVGLVKFDFLGLKTLDVIDHAEKLVNARIRSENARPQAERDAARAKHPHARTTQGDIPLLNVTLLELGDPDTYKLVASGATVGVFQCESSGFQELMKKLKPDRFEDIIAAVALYRPGPMKAGMVDDFVDRKHGRQKVEFLHPMLEGVLKPTYGTIVYQEQVMQIAQVLCGYTLGGADLLRRAMGKKDAAKMAKERGKFVEGAVHNGVNADQAGNIFDLVEKFAGYGFNKSHSAAYALVTYQTAYLKAHYPLEFMAALLTTEMGSTDNVVKYIAEARSMGMKVLPPCVNEGQRDFAVIYGEPPAIRFGLGAIKGMGDAAIGAVLEARQQGGAFKNLFDFCERVPMQKVNKKALEVLVKSGAMDSFGRPRNQLFQSMDRAVEAAQSTQRDQEVGQFGLFGALTFAASMNAEQYPDVPEWMEKQRLEFEKEAIGFYLTGHPLWRFQADMNRLGSASIGSLGDRGHLAEVGIAGVVVALKERLTKDGNRWAAVTLEDLSGQVEVLVFSKAYAAAEALLKKDEPVYMKGRVLVEEGADENAEPAVKVRCEEVKSLADIRAAQARRILVHVKPDDAERNLRALHKLAGEFTGPCSLRLQLFIPNEGYVVLDTDPAFKVSPADEFVQRAEQILGRGSVEVL